MNTVLIYSVSATVIITAVSTAAAKATLGRLTTINGMIYADPTRAVGHFITAELIGQTVRMTSQYFTETSLLEEAYRASGRGTVTVAGK
jgi:hypothetical protein